MSFKEIRDACICAYFLDMIDEEELSALLTYYDSGNKDLELWSHVQFSLENYNEDECDVFFRFQKHHIYRLAALLQLPPFVATSHNVRVPAVEALCMLLRRYASPCRLSDLLPIFGRNVPTICVTVLSVTQHIYTRWSHLMETFNQTWLQPNALEEYAAAIHEKGALLRNCWGFIDGTLRPCCRPKVNQRLLYNGHKRTHGLKFQSIIAPNGLIVNLFGPVEGCRHDSGMIAMSAVMDELRVYSHDTQGNVLCVYGDQAYQHTPQLQRPYRDLGFLTNEEVLFNRLMAKVRVSVEWCFGDVVTYFAYFNYYKNLRIGMSPIGSMYVVSAVLMNARTILYGNLTSNFFEVEPPSLDEYFS